MKIKKLKKLLLLSFIGCSIGSLGVSAISSPNNHDSFLSVNRSDRITNDVSYIYDYSESYNFNVNEHYNITSVNNNYFVNVVNNESYFTLTHTIDNDYVILSYVYVSYSVSISSFEDDSTLGMFGFTHVYYPNINLGDIEHGCLSDFLIHKLDIAVKSKMNYKSSYIDSFYLDDNIAFTSSDIGNINGVSNTSISYLYDFYNVYTILDISNYFDVFANSVNLRSTGYDEGFREGKDVGYSQGITEGDNNLKLMTLMRAIFESPSYLLHNMFNFEIFGINISALVLFFMTLGIVLLIFAIIRRSK